MARWELPPTDFGVLDPFHDEAEEDYEAHFGPGASLDFDIIHRVASLHAAALIGTRSWRVEPKDRLRSLDAFSGPVPRFSDLRIHVLALSDPEGASGTDVEGATDSTTIGITPSPRGESGKEGTSLLPALHGVVWLLLVLGSMVWGVLTGVSFVYDYWLGPVEGVFGLTLLCGLAATMWQLSRSRV